MSFHAFLQINKIRKSKIVPKFHSQGPCWPKTNYVVKFEDRKRSRNENYDLKANTLNRSDGNKTETNNESPLRTVDTAYDRNLSPIIGRLNNFTTKSYYEEFRETAKYSNPQIQQSNYDSLRKNKQQYIDILEAHPKTAV